MFRGVGTWTWKGQGLDEEEVYIMHPTPMAPMARHDTIGHAVRMMAWGAWRDIMLVL